MRLLTVTHTQRWHAYHHSAGTGPLYLFAAARSQCEIETG
jgi:hypothetical protein